MKSLTRFPIIYNRPKQIKGGLEVNYKKGEKEQQ